MSLLVTESWPGVTRPRPRSSPVAATDGWIVVAAAASLALFEGPVSLRKLRSGIAGLPVDVTVGRGVASRIAWCVLLVPLLLVVWRLGARELARRRGIAESTALHAEALPFVPFVLLLAGFAPGWGDTHQEPWSFAILFLFLGTATASAALRLGIWHVGFPASASGSRPARACALYLLAGLMLIAVWRSGALVPVQPHWSTLADRSPYWPTHGYVALWTATALYASLPLLSIPALLLRAERLSSARAAAFGIACAVVTGGLGAASADRAIWDDAFLRFRVDAEGATSVIAGGARVSGFALPVPGRRSWSWRPASEQAAIEPTRLRIRARAAPVPQASLWYRSASPVELRVVAESDGERTELARWSIDPRTRPLDRRAHSLDTTSWVLPGRTLLIWVEATGPGPSGVQSALQVLADVEIDEAAGS